MPTIQDDLIRIQNALDATGPVFASLSAQSVEVQHKEGGDPVTQVDHAVNDVLRQALPRDQEGWLSEETKDDPTRLTRRRVWIVDPLDGTREFVKGLPEYCVSIALVEDGDPIAGGIFNPATHQVFLGGRGCGVSLNGHPARMSERRVLEGTVVLASRSEVGRGEWVRFGDAPLKVRPMGSVAYKLALVASGLADVTWTLVPKHEWDVAAGVALVRAAGGSVFIPDGSPLVFNKERPLLTGLVAAGAGLSESLKRFLREHP